jgi:hypothetical protein
MTSRDRAAAALRWLPPPSALLILTVGAVLVAVVFAKGIRDADYFWHVTAGRLIATTGSIPNTDPFSFTWGGQPWTPHEWLSELMLYVLVSGPGPAATLVVFGLIGAGVAAVTGWLLLRLGARPFAVGAGLALLAWVMAPYLTVRPQAVSWLMLALLLSALALIRPPQRRWMLALGPFFALWANLHGLWVVGLGVVGLYGLFTLAGRTPMSAARWWVAAGVTLCLAGSMVTPAGPAGILYPLRYVDAGDWGLANIQEWQSPNFHDAGHLGLLALVVALVVTGGRRAPGWMVALSWIGMVMALVSMRNSPVAAILAAPALGLGFEDWLRSRSRARQGRRELRPAIQLTRRLMEVGAALAIVAVAFGVARPAGGSLVREGDYPAAGATRLAEAHPGVRVIGEYGWGGYLIFRLSEGGGRVFIDGRNDMYSQAILDDYSTIRDADPGWEAIADAYEADAILFPPGYTIAKVADQSDAWCEAYRDAHQVLLLRSCGGT